MDIVYICIYTEERVLPLSVQLLSFFFPAIFMYIYIYIIIYMHTYKYLYTYMNIYEHAYCIYMYM